MRLNRNTCSNFLCKFNWQETCIIKQDGENFEEGNASKLCEDRQTFESWNCKLQVSQYSKNCIILYNHGTMHSQNGGMNEPTQEQLVNKSMNIISCILSLEHSDSEVFPGLKII